MARTWALEIDPEGITVNVVAPGPILTGNFWGIVPKGSEREEAIGAQLQVRRLGTVEDVARAVEFFANPASLQVKFSSYVEAAVLEDFRCSPSDTQWIGS